jgi:hypothetical protein
MIKMCQKCDKPYVVTPEEEYKIYCMPCFKTERAWKLSASDQAYVLLQAEYASLQQQNTTLTKALRRCKKAPPKGKMPTIPYRDLLRLCHPDRHQNSALSKRITQWILENRS